MLISRRTFLKATIGVAAGLPVNHGPKARDGADKVG